MQWHELESWRILWQGLLTKNPLKRTKIEEVFSHPFFGREWRAWNEAQKLYGLASMESEASMQTVFPEAEDTEMQFAESPQKPGKSDYQVDFCEAASV